MRYKHTLIAILVIGAVLRLLFISAGDPINDEASSAFRSIGLLDFDLAEFQTTPLEWFDPEIPRWTSLSFHDHPPLVFWIEHVAMGLFGETRFGFRIGAALFGIATIWLVYKIGARLYGNRAGLIAGALYAVTVNAVHYARVGMQESFVIFFILLTIYLTLQGKHAGSRYVWAGVVFGLALLTKYTAIFLVPALALHVFFEDRRAFKQKYLWMGVMSALLVFTPVILYNLFLYRARGHFDFQLSYLFGQNPSEWQVAPGKEIGTLGERIGNFLPRLLSSSSWLLLAAVASAALAFLLKFAKKPLAASQKHRALLLFFIFGFLLILVVGPAYRFLALLTPFFVIAVAAFFNALYEKFRGRGALVSMLLSCILVFEVFYTVNNEIVAYARGPSIWLASPLKHENERWGYSKLDDYLSRELSGRYPGIVFAKKYAFLEDVQNESIAEAKRHREAPYRALFVYDRDIFNMAQLWVFDRRFMYEGWPFIRTEQYYEMIADSGANVFKDAGFEELYFITPTPEMKLRRMTPISTLARTLETELASQNVVPEIIEGPKKLPMFLVYLKIL